MKTPWTDKTGLAKAIAISATALGICTGLGGLNLVSSMLFLDSFTWTVTFLLLAGYAELFVMAVSLIALFVLAIIYAVRSSIKDDARRT